MPGSNQTDKERVIVKPIGDIPDPNVGVLWKDPSCRVLKGFSDESGDPTSLDYGIERTWDLCQETCFLEGLEGIRLVRLVI